MKQVKIQAIDDVLIEGEPLPRGAQLLVDEDVAIRAAVSGRVFIVPELPAVETASATPVK